MTYYRDGDLTVRTLAAPLSCKPDSGFVNDLNSISQEGGFDACRIYGEMFRHYLSWKLADLDRVCPPTATAAPPIATPA